MDDQDLMFDVFEYMPRVRKLMVEQGTSFTQHRIPLSQCSPSRTSLMIGRHAHNTNVTGPRPPYGGYEKFAAFIPENVAVQMQMLGYTTHYTGKFMGGYTEDMPRVEGWTDWRPFLDPWVYDFNQTLLGVWPPTGTAPQLSWFKGVAHQNTAMACTVRDMIAGKQAEKQASNNGEDYDPFFMVVAPIVPHDETLFDVGCENPGGFVISADPFVCAVMTPPTPLPRHAEMFSDVKIPRNPVFNPDDELQGTKTPAWLRAMHKLNQTQENWLDYVYQQRLRSVQSVDEMFHDMILQLKEQQMLNDTYIIYTSDNGYHYGQWRLPPTKLTPYDFDNRVPLVIRGPGIEKGVQSNAPTSHLDFYGAFVTIGGGEAPPSIDGLPNFLGSNEREFMLSEYWGGYVSQQPQEFPLPQGPWITQATNGGQIAWSYKGITTHNAEYHFKYVYYCHGTAELYDLAADPWEMDNLFPMIHKKKKFYRIVDRLDALLYVLSTCSGSTCNDPLAVFANAAVEAGLWVPKTFDQAVHYKYDAIFRDAPRPHFLKCSIGYVLENEPQRPYPIEDILLEEPGPADASLIASKSPIGDMLVPADGLGVLSDTPALVKAPCKVKEMEKFIEEEIKRVNAEIPTDMAGPLPPHFKMTQAYFPPLMCKAVLRAGEYMGKVYAQAALGLE